MTVTVLKTGPKECNQNVVARLEEVLEAARSGGIVAVGIAIVYANRDISSCWSTGDPAGLLIGATALLQHQLIASCAD